jgi:hypothetical protein
MTNFVVVPGQGTNRSTQDTSVGILELTVGQKARIYSLFGHKSVRKAVCMKPGSLQPTDRAGSPAQVQ